MVLAWACGSAEGDSAVCELVPDHVNDVVGGGVDSFLGVNVRADLGDRVLNGESGR